jgi:hypothetical protein
MSEDKFSDGVASMALSCRFALNLIEAEKATFQSTQQWLNAVLASCGRLPNGHNVGFEKAVEAYESGKVAHYRKPGDQEGIRNSESHGFMASRLVVLFFLIAFCASCSHLTVAPKPAEAHAIAFDLNTQNAGIIAADKTGVLVTPGWIAKYQALENKFPPAPRADAAIKPEGANFRVPYEASDHFTDMKAVERAEASGP